MSTAVRAITVAPGSVGSAALHELDGPVGEGALLVQGIAIGVCGTDLEILGGRYGQPPPGRSRLVIGHESLGRVVEAPASSDLATGDLVVGIVRRPDPVPCSACRVGEWDMCRNGRYTERGIKALDGYAAELWRVEPGFAVKAEPDLGELNVLVEPASVVAKAWEQIDRIGGRSEWAPRRALITGAGPIGMLAALMAVQRDLEAHIFDRIDRGPKPNLTALLGAIYHTGSIEEVPSVDVVVECTGAGALVFDAIRRLTPGGIVCLTGVSSGSRTLGVDADAVNRELVLENHVVFGSVNANRRHYEAAARSLRAADHGWLERLITRRVPLDRWPDALERNADDIKAVLSFGR